MWSLEQLGNPVKLLIAESKEFNSHAQSLLSEYFTVELRDLERHDLVNQLQDVDVLWVRLRNRIDKEVIDSAPKLQIIVSNTTGLNHIDCEYAASRQIQVLSLRGETDFLRDIRGTAEHTIGLMLSLMRRIPAAYQDVINGRWDRYPFRGSEIFRKTVGIIGYGRLGRIVATYLHAFGAHVLVADSHLGDEIPSHATVAELPGLLGQSDIVTLHASYNPENAGLIGEREFQQMKRGAYFINTARGELVDESALLRALESGHLAGAALDVLSNEHALDLCYHPLRNYAASHDNLLLTPHIGGNTVESGAATELFLARKLIARLPSQTAK